MSYNLEALHNLYVHKITVKNNLQAQRKKLTKQKKCTKSESNDLVNCISKLNNEYSSILDSVDEYMLDNIEIISIIGTNEEISKELYNNYVKKYFSTVAQLHIQESTNCPICGIYNWVEIKKSDTTVCVDCGFVKSAHAQVVSYEKSLELKMRGKKGGYSKSKSLCEFLDYVQLRKKVLITNGEENNILIKLKDIKPEKLNINLVQTAMQILGYSHLYNDKYYIYYLITGDKVELSKGTRIQIERHFFQMQKAFELLRKKHGRINIFIYKYSTKKIAELILFKLKNPKYMPLTKPLIDVSYPDVNDLSEVKESELVKLLKIIPHPIVQSFENLYKYDAFWEQVCFYLGWKFESSF